MQRSCRSLLVLIFGILTALPAFSQVDLSGEWGQTLHEDQPERGPGPDIGDYTALPINDAARLRGDSWDANKWAVPEHQCEPHPADYAPRGPGSMTVWSDIDPYSKAITAWHSLLLWMVPYRTIYMDNRPHPPDYAAHTWQGFSTGEWEGDMLKVTTTHLKEGWTRRNGIPRSTKGTLVEYYIRHGDVLTLASIVRDPGYLTEPLVRTLNWTLQPGYSPAPSYCVPSKENDNPQGWVAHHLPGTNRWLHEYSDRYGIPYEATRGGAEQMYPEYVKKLAKMPRPSPPQTDAPGNHP